MSIDARLESLGIVLPAAPQAGGNYLTARRAGSLWFLSGVVSSDHGTVLTGVVGAERTVEEGYAAARACGLLHLAVLRDALGSLDHVEGIVSVSGFVQAAAHFTAMPAVLNGYSDLMVEVFGEAGRHVRTAVGVSSLPRAAMVEVQAVAAVRA